MTAQYERSSVVVPKKTEEDTQKGKRRVGEATKGKGFLNIGVVSTSTFLILELIFCLAESSRMCYVLSRCQRKDQSDERASLLGRAFTVRPRYPRFFIHVHRDQFFVYLYIWTA